MEGHLLASKQLPDKPGHHFLRELARPKRIVGARGNDRQPERVAVRARDHLRGRLGACVGVRWVEWGRLVDADTVAHSRLAVHLVRADIDKPVRPSHSLGARCSGAPMLPDRLQHDLCAEHIIAIESQRTRQPRAIWHEGRVDVRLRSHMDHGVHLALAQQPHY